MFSCYFIFIFIALYNLILEQKYPHKFNYLSGVCDSLWHREILWKSCFHEQTLVVWSSLVPGSARILGTQGDPQHPLSWGHGKHPNHNTEPQGVGLTRNLRKFSLSGLHSFSKGSCGPFLFQLGQLTAKENTEFPSINSQLRCLLSEQIITPYLQQTLHSLTKLCAKKRRVLLPLNLPAMSCQQRLPRCRKFALCPFDFYSGDTPARGVIQQTARQLDRWKARLLPLYEGLSPILGLWQELIRAWEERQQEAERASDTHMHTHICTYNPQQERYQSII